MPLTRIGRQVAALSEEVIERVKALNAPITYRVKMHCTLRSGPSKAAPTLARWAPTTNKGKPRLVKGRAAVDGWVEIIEAGETKGYIKAGALRRLGGNHAS